MIYLQTDWWRAWNSLVSSSDSSREGFGVSTFNFVSGPCRRSKEVDSVWLGSACFRSCLRIITEVNKRHLPWILENSLSSRCWNLHPIRGLLDQQQEACLDFCMLYNYLPDSRRVRACRGHNGYCSWTHRAFDQGRSRQQTVDAVPNHIRPNCATLWH